MSPKSTLKRTRRHTLLIKLLIQSHSAMLNMHPRYPYANRDKTLHCILIQLSNVLANLWFDHFISSTFLFCNNSKNIPFLLSPKSNRKHISLSSSMTLLLLWHCTVRGLLAVCSCIEIKTVWAEWVIAVFKAWIICWKRRGPRDYKSLSHSSGSEKDRIETRCRFVGD